MRSYCSGRRRCRGDWGGRDSEGSCCGCIDFARLCETLARLEADDCGAGRWPEMAINATAHGHTSRDQRLLHGRNFCSGRTLTETDEALGHEGRVRWQRNSRCHGGQRRQATARNQRRACALKETTTQSILRRHLVRHGRSIPCMYELSAQQLYISTISNRSRVCFEAGHNTNTVVRPSVEHDIPAQSARSGCTEDFDTNEQAKVSWTNT